MDRRTFLRGSLVYTIAARLSWRDRPPAPAPAEPWTGTVTNAVGEPCIVVEPPSEPLTLPGPPPVLRTGRGPLVHHGLWEADWIPLGDRRRPRIDIHGDLLEYETFREMPDSWGDGLCIDLDRLPPDPERTVVKLRVTDVAAEIMETGGALRLLRRAPVLLVPDMADGHEMVEVFHRLVLVEMSNLNPPGVVLTYHAGEVLTPSNPFGDMPRTLDHTHGPVAYSTWIAPSDTEGVASTS